MRDWERTWDWDWDSDWVSGRGSGRVEGGEVVVWVGTTDQPEGREWEREGRSEPGKGRRRARGTRTRTDGAGDQGRVAHD